MKRTTREWVRKAEADYLAANRLRRGSGPLHDVVCFHCQQCQASSALRWAGQVRTAVRALLGIRERRRRK